MSFGPWRLDLLDDDGGLLPRSLHTSGLPEGGEEVDPNTEGRSGESSRLGEDSLVVIRDRPLPT